MVIKEECRLCGRVFPYYKLKRCSRCGRLYCRDCMVEDLASGEPGLVCLRCARETVSPRAPPGNKYSPLTRYLVNLSAYTNRTVLSFSRMGGIIGDSLPESAFKNESWWKNVDSTLQGHSWLLAGWKVESVDLEKRVTVFQKAEPLGRETRRRRRRAQKKLKKPFTPAPVRPKRKRVVSKTRMSKALARLQNLQRRAALPKYRGKFKPRPAHEKRLYKPEAKPTRNA